MSVVIRETEDIIPQSLTVHLSYTKYKDTQDIPLWYSAAAMAVTSPISVVMSSPIIKDLHNQNSISIGYDEQKYMSYLSTRSFLTDDNILSRILFYDSPTRLKSLNWVHDEYEPQQLTNESPTQTDDALLTKILCTPP